MTLEFPPGGRALASSSASPRSFRQPAWLKEPRGLARGMSRHISCTSAAPLSRARSGGVRPHLVTTLTACKCIRCRGIRGGAGLPRPELPGGSELAAGSVPEQHSGCALAAWCSLHTRPSSAQKCRSLRPPPTCSAPYSPT